MIASVANRGKIDLFYLSSDCPELNPEKRFNADLKQAIGAKVAAHTKANANPWVIDELILNKSRSNGTNGVAGQTSCRLRSDLSGPPQSCTWPTNHSATGVQISTRNPSRSAT